MAAPLEPQYELPVSINEPRPATRSPARRPKKRVYESSDDEVEETTVEALDEPATLDLDGGVLLSDEAMREIAHRPTKPSGDSEWRVEWSAERRCWSWIHHETHGQLFENPSQMDEDARDHAARTAPIATFESHSLQITMDIRPAASQVWTPEEEQQLRDLVAELGAGDWTAKSNKFHTTRSASSLRHRWYSVHAVASPAGSSPGAPADPQRTPYADDLNYSAASWTKEEDDALRKVRNLFLSNVTLRPYRRTNFKPGAHHF